MLLEFYILPTSVLRNIFILVNFRRKTDRLPSALIGEHGLGRVFSLMCSNRPTQSVMARYDGRLINDTKKNHMRLKICTRKSIYEFIM